MTGGGDHRPLLTLVQPYAQGSEVAWSYYFFLAGICLYDDTMWIKEVLAIGL